MNFRYKIIFRLLWKFLKFNIQTSRIFEFRNFFMIERNLWNLWTSKEFQKNLMLQDFRIFFEFQMIFENSLIFETFHGKFQIFRGNFEFQKIFKENSKFNEMFECRKEFYFWLSKEFRVRILNDFWNKFKLQDTFKKMFNFFLKKFQLQILS